MISMTRRMSTVQAPVIPIVGELIRAHPGTISLGQGVVHYGPPPSAMACMNAFFEDGENHKYKAVEGIAPLIEALSTKLAAKNKIGVNAANRIVVVVAVVVVDVTVIAIEVEGVVSIIWIDRRRPKPQVSCFTPAQRPL